MFLSMALLVVGLNGPGLTNAANAPGEPGSQTTQASALHLDGDAAQTSPWALSVALRAPTFGFDGDAFNRNRALVHALATPTPSPSVSQALSNPSTATADPTTQTQQSPRSVGAVSGGAESGASSGTCESCDIDCETCRESDRQARYVTRRRSTTLRVHRAIALSALGSLAVTEVLGAFLLVNRRSPFGPGECESSVGSPVLGQDFGCGTGLGALHLTTSFITTALYTTAGILAVAAPDPDGADQGNSRAARTLRLHKALAWVHGAGMVLMPLLGILAARPQLVGIDPITDAGAPNPTFQDFQSGLRLTHAVVGFSTLIALSIAAAVELF